MATSLTKRPRRVWCLLLQRTAAYAWSEICVSCRAFMSPPVASCSSHRRPLVAFAATNLFMSEPTRLSLQTTMCDYYTRGKKLADAGCPALVPFITIETPIYYYIQQRLDY